MDNCIFCKIVNGQVDAYNLYEDRDYIAILDIMPYVKGQTVVIRKKHLDSRIFENSDIEIKKIIMASKKVAGMLKLALEPERVCLVFEGKGVSHLHAKLYPMHKRKNESDAEFVTPRGHKAAKEELETIYKRIITKNKSSNK
jgi:diadenosine tetraphosphate (Ap4A) HIT family hydrolase